MSNVRKCEKCGQSALTLMHRKMEVYNSVYHFKCENCDEEVEIVPIASTGIFASVSIMVLTFWGYILFFHGTGNPGTVTAVVYGIAALAAMGIVGSALKSHIQNPEIRNVSQLQDVPTENSQHIGKRPILWMEKLGFIAGLFAPVIFIGVILGGAALIGYINFTYFSG